MAQYFYSFSDFAEGSFSSGNGITVVTPGPADGAHTIVPSGNSKVLRLSRGASNGQGLTAFNALKGHPDNTESLVLFSVSATHQVPGSYGVSFWDYTAQNKGLSLGFLPAYNKRALTLYDDKAGKTAQYVNYDWQNNQKYWLRWRVERGENHFIRIWPNGSPEPSTWTMTTKYKNRVTGDRHMGIGTYTSNSYIDYYQVGIGTGGDTAPSSVPNSYTQSGTFRVYRAPTDATVAGYSAGYSGAYGLGYAAAFYPTATQVEKSQAGRFRVRKDLTHTQPGRFRVRKEFTTSQSGRFRTRKMFYKVSSGRFRIASEPSRLQLGQFRVRTRNYKTVAGRFSISEPLGKNQSGRFRIQKTSNVSQPGIFRTQTLESQFQSGLFNISVEPHKHIAGQFRIRTVRHVLQSGQFRVESVSEKNQPGVFRVEYLGTKDQSGTFRIYGANTLPEVFLKSERYLAQEGSGGVIHPTSEVPGKLYAGYETMGEIEKAKVDLSGEYKREA